MNADDQWYYYSGVRDANCVNTENQWCYYNGVKDANYVNTDDQWCYYRGVKDANIWEDTILNTNLSKNDFLTIFFRGNGKVIKILWKSCHHAKLPSQNNKIKPSYTNLHEVTSTYTTIILANVKIKYNCIMNPGLKKFRWFSPQIFCNSLTNKNWISI